MRLVKTDVNYDKAVLGVIQEARNRVQTSLARDLFQYLIDYYFTAKEASFYELKTEVCGFYQNESYYSRFLRKIKLKKIPPRIRAFEQEISDRINIDLN